MPNVMRTIGEKKRIALIAHDSNRKALIEWATFNSETLRQHRVYASGTNGKLLEQELGVEITRLQSAHPSTPTLQDALQCPAAWYASAALAAPTL